MSLYKCYCICDDLLWFCFVVPRPSVRITSINTQTLYEATTLECRATTVRGITSRVDIIWSTGRMTVKRVNGVTPKSVGHSMIYTDQLVTPPLSINDNGRVYECQVIINAYSRIRSSRNIVLDFLGENHYRCVVIW